MGVYRLLLALSVALGHAGPPFGLFFIPGAFAVQAFYLISGFLITLILNEKYGPDQNWLFYTNRALRIYVPYLVVWFGAVAAALVALEITGGWPTYIPSFIAALHNDPVVQLFALVTNLAILGQDAALFLAYDNGFHFSSNFWSAKGAPWSWQVISPAWSVALELNFYIVAPFLMRRPPIVLLCVFAASMAARIFAGLALGLTYDPWFHRFFPFELALFVAGGLSYHLLGAIRRRSWHLPLNVQVVTGAFVLATIFFQGLPWTIIQSAPLAIWVYYAAIVFALPFLFLFDQRYAWDRRLGSMSYPVYLLHWPVQGLVIQFVGAALPASWRGLLAVACTLALAVVFVALVDAPLERARQRRVGSSKGRLVGPLSLSADPAKAHVIPAGIER